MTAPRFADCHCGHNRMSHEVESAPACIHDGCGCGGYRPRTGPPSVGSPVDQLLAAGKRSDVRSIVSLAERIEKNLDELRVKLAEDREAAAVRAEVRRLEEQLAAAKAKLRGEKAKPVATTPTGEHACSDCDRSFDTPQGRAMHQRRAHEGFDPNAAKVGAA